jgi:RNA polymerase sigma factor (sigma-70 family)
MPAYRDAPATPVRMTTDQNAQRLLQNFLAHRGRIERQVLRQVGCPATTADLLQSLFLRLWHRGPPQAELSGAYLARSARNLAIDHQRATRSRPHPQGEPTAETPCHRPDPEQALAAGQAAQTIRDALLDLPPRTRQIFLLNRARRLSYAAIARALGISVSTVEKEMMRALAACRAALPDR